jgi:hypothetical protein
MGTKIVQTECNGKSNLFEFAIAEVQPILFKDSANQLYWQIKLV